MGIITILWEKWVEFRRDFYKITLAAMIAPLMYLVVFGMGIQTVSHGQPYLNFLIPGVVSLTTMNGSFNAIAQNLNVHLIGRATKTKIELDQDYIDERLPVAGKEMIYRQVENSFTQPNAAMNIQMLEWALDVTKGSKGDLLELYCGNGNFSLALARNFDRVLATEIAKPSVAAAQYNIAANHIDNVQIIRMAAEEFTQAMNGVREFNRLQGIDLKSYQCETIFVDPPRSGLDSETEKMVQAYPRILYISCNPETLCKNLETLSQTHKVERLALFDQFPYTHHMECGVLLTAK